MADINKIEQPDAREFVLERLTFHACRTFHAGSVKPSVWLEDQLRSLVAQLELHVTGQTLPSATATLCVSWPATWWQHFKEAWLPKWAVRRWPVVYVRQENTIELRRYVVYPDFVLPEAKYGQMHVLVEAQPERRFGRFVKNSKELDPQP